MAEHKIDVKAGDLEDDSVVPITVSGVEIALLKHDGKLHALDGKCTHQGGPLGKGKIENGKLICPWHNGAFDIGSGAASEDTPWVTGIRSYRTRVDSETGEIYIEV